jgi:hypothetical protein
VVSFLLIPVPALAEGGTATIDFGKDAKPGVVSEAIVIDLPPSVPDDSGWVGSSGGVGLPQPVALAAHNCGVLYMGGNAGLSLADPLEDGGSTDCAALAPPAVRPRDVDPSDPAPSDLAAIAFARARDFADVPTLVLAPSGRGITGLRSYFWLGEVPATVSATASAGATSVTAEAYPVTYTWSFGDGAGTTTYGPGRPWSRQQPGSIGHVYETKGNYSVGVEVLYEARFSINGGPWQPLGYFSTSDERPYRVNEVIAALSRSRR